MPKDKAEEFLSKAWSVSQDRYGKYGDPSPLFNAVAHIWGGFLGIKSLSGPDVAMMMSMFKVIRHQFSGDEDDLLDVVGYAVNAADMEATVAARESA